MNVWATWTSHLGAVFLRMTTIAGASSMLDFELPVPRMSLSITTCRHLSINSGKRRGKPSSMQTGQSTRPSGDDGRRTAIGDQPDVLL